MTKGVIPMTDLYIIFFGGMHKFEALAKEVDFEKGLIELQPYRLN